MARIFTLFSNWIGMSRRTTDDLSPTLSREIRSKAGVEEARAILGAPRYDGSTTSASWGASPRSTPLYQGIDRTRRTPMRSLAILG